MVAAVLAEMEEAAVANLEETAEAAVVDLEEVVAALALMDLGGVAVALILVVIPVEAPLLIFQPTTLVQIPKGPMARRLAFLV
jgi:hypothetical protein